MSEFTELGTTDIHAAVRCFYVDSGKLNNFNLTPDDVRRLTVARGWIDELLKEQVGREEKAA